jgi:threonine dehydrogenase-like Zn-dependent dehydrogenase
MAKELIAMNGTVQCREFPETGLASGQVRVRSEFGAAKHGTELAFILGHGNRRGSWSNSLQLFEAASTPENNTMSLGCMMVGTVVEKAGDVASLDIGNRVYAWASFRTEHVLKEKECYLMPADMPWQAAVCNDPAHFALGSVRDGNVRVGDNAAIFGMGAIGLMAIQFARRAGAMKIIAVDPAENRRQAALALGADFVVDPIAQDAGLEIKRLTEKRGADVCIEVSGNRLALQHALRGVAYRGKVVCGAFPNPYDAGLDFGAEAHLNIPDIIFSRACSNPDRDHPRWDHARIISTCRDLLMGGAFRCEEIVMPVVPFEKLAQEFLRVMRDPKAGIKLGVKF